MRRPVGTRERATSKPIIVIAGEDATDRESLRTLLAEFCPAMRGRLVAINDAPRFRDATQPKTLRERVSRFARLVRARAARENAEVACVFVHEDLDSVDGDRYDSIRERVQKALTAELGTAHYVLAAWEMEAWLLLFPDALNQMVRSWNVPDRYRGRDTGRLSEPKKIMMYEVSSGGRRYQESDAPNAFALIVAQHRVDHPVGLNRSWTHLREASRECCATHIPAPRKQDS